VEVPEEGGHMGDHPGHFLSYELVEMLQIATLTQKSLFCVMLLCLACFVINVENDMAQSLTFIQFDPPSFPEVCCTISPTMGYCVTK
jgi:hypothetical protein